MATHRYLEPSNRTRVHQLIAKDTTPKAHHADAGARVTLKRHTDLLIPFASLRLFVLTANKHMPCSFFLGDFSFAFD